jgi:hypothetical protein
MRITKTRNILDLNQFQIEAKLVSSKITYVFKEGDDSLHFNLSEALTSQEDSDLNDLVTNFVDSDPSQKVPKIIGMAKEYSKHFHAINYIKGLNQSLIPKRTVVQGEVVKVEWYKSLDAQMQPTDLVLKVDITYTRDATGFATSRVTTRTWINLDESENEDTKVSNKYYFVNPSDMIDEGLRRRKLLVSSIQIPTLTAMTEALMPLGYSQEACVLKGRAFMDDYENDFNKFVDNSSTITDPASPDVGMKSIVVRLRDEDKLDYVEWLDKAPPSLGGTTTIRQYLMNEFSI